MEDIFEKRPMYSKRVDLESVKNDKQNMEKSTSAAQIQVA